MSSSQTFPSFSLVLAQDRFIKFSVSEFIFSMCFAGPLLFWPQKTTALEIPAVAVPTVTVNQVNHNPVRSAGERLGMRIWVRNGVMCAFIF